MFEAQVYKNRRLALAAAMRKRGISEGLILLHANFKSPRTYQDNCYPFRQDSSWLYFIGLDHPGMAATIDVENGVTLLFGEEPTLSDLIWTGPQPKLLESAALSGIERVGAYASLSDHLEKMRRTGLGIHTIPPYQAAVEKAFLHFLGAESGTLGARALIESVVELRQIKEAREIEAIEQAVGITVDVHKALVGALKPGWTELDAAAFIQRKALDHGAELGFETIATVRGETLHNHPSARICREGDLFLLDAGAEIGLGYSGDLTTTFPVGRRFSSRQKDLYFLLSRVFDKALEHLGPGRLFLNAHMAACLELAKGLGELGLMKGDPQEAVALGAHALFFPHGLGHMIGLDVHDMENLGEDAVGYGAMARSGQFGLRSLRLAKALEPGMVHSVEPGIYFIPGLIDRWRTEGRACAYIDYDALEGWKGEKGMRLEEDWLVTTGGSRRLGPDFNRSVEAIEGLRA
jgi:Xaa-Pro aminopeptidase